MCACVCLSVHTFLRVMEYINIFWFLYKIKKLIFEGIEFCIVPPLKDSSWV